MKITVSEDQWSALSSDDQQKIIAAFMEAKLIEQGDTIVGGSSPFVEGEDEHGVDKGWNPKKDICKKLCDVAAGTAVAWCTANTSGAGLVACMAAAEVARKACRKRC